MGAALRTMYPPMPESPTGAFHDHAPPRWPMVVVTPVNLLCDRGSAEFHPTVRQAAQLLIDADIPIILVARSVVREPEYIQRELGVVHPYLSNGGATLHIPYGYFGGGYAGPGADWEMMTFVARDPGVEPPSGVQFLLQTYRIHRSDIVTVGFGVTSSDRFVLEHVEVPVLVRNRHFDQRPLRKTFPDAFMTTLEGPLGWSEAILGGLAYEADETGMMAMREPVMPR